MSLVRASGAAATVNPTTGWTATLSGSIVAGDYVVVPVLSKNHSSADAYPSVSDDGGGAAWTFLGETATNRKFTLWGKVAVAGTAGATLTVSGCLNSSSGGYTAFISDGTNRITNLTPFVNSSGVESVTGFTPDEADSEIVLILGCAADDKAFSSQSTTDPGALTELWEKLSTGGNDCSSAYASAQQTGGPTATGNFTYSMVDDTSTGFIFAFSPVTGTTVSPGTGQLDLTGFAPIIPTTIVAGFGELILNGFAPTILTGTTVSPGTGQLVLDGFAPIIPTTIIAGVGQLTLDGFAPNISTPVTITPGFGQLILTGFEPTISLPVTVSPSFGELILNGFEPTIITTGAATVTPGTGILLLDGFAPIISVPIPPVPPIDVCIKILPIYFGVSAGAVPSFQPCSGTGQQTVLGGTGFTPCG